MFIYSLCIYTPTYRSLTEILYSDISLLKPTHAADYKILDESVKTNFDAFILLGNVSCTDIVVDGFL